MAFDEHKVLRFLYEHDNGNFWVINDLIKQSPPPLNYSDIVSGLNRLASQPNPWIYVLPTLSETSNEGHFSYLGKKLRETEITLDNLQILARITPEGRVLYQNAYLAQDNAESQQRINESIISTNLFIKLTFVVALIGAFIQLIGIIVSAYESEKTLKGNTNQDSSTIESHCQRH